MKKVVLITGVSKGLGKAMALKFLSEGYEVAGASRSEPDFELSFFMKADITDDDNRKKLIESVIQKFGQIDVLINNAGIGLYIDWESMSIDDLRKEFELNFFAMVSITKFVLPFLKRSKGTIINISSVAGKSHCAYMGGYNASKYAVEAFSKSLRAEMKPYGINVLNIAPGRIKTGFGSNILGGKKSPGTPLKAEPHVFAVKLFKAFKRKKRDVVFPGWYRVFIVFTKLFPNFYDKISLKKWNRGKS